MNKLQSSLLKKGKKGFTLTELAIVIAVIAILIAVLVPTFTSVINNARRTTAAETAKNALTEYTVETYSSVPDDSYVIYEGYCWKVENGSFEVSDDIDPDDANYTTDTVQYSWGKEADAGITDVKLYIPTEEMTQSVAKVIAKNIVVEYTAATANSSKTVKYIGVSYVDNSGSDAGSKFALAAAVLTAEGDDTDGDGDGDGSTDDGSPTTTYYYFSVDENGNITSYNGTPSDSGLTKDETSYSGIVIYYEKEADTTSTGEDAEDGDDDDNSDNEGNEGGEGDS